MTGYRIDASAEDVVRLDVHGLTIRIEGPTWRDANDAAHIIGRLLADRADLDKLRTRMIGLNRCVKDIEDALASVTKTVESVTEYAVEIAREGHGDG